MKKILIKIQQTVYISFLLLLFTTLSLHAQWTPVGTQNVQGNPIFVHANGGQPSAGAIYVGHGNDAVVNGQQTGAYNLAIGNGGLIPLGQNQSRHNTAIGNAVLGSFKGNVGNIYGYNTGVGYGAMALLDSGNSNTAMGYVAMGNHKFSYSNTAYGYEALSGTAANPPQNANNNAAFGRGAIANIQTGDGNTGIGYGSLGLVTTGSNNVGLGSGASVPNGDNQLSIQNVIFGTNMHSGSLSRLRLGNYPAATTIAGTVVGGITVKLRIDGVDNLNNSVNTIPSLQLGHVPTYTGTLPVSNPTGTGKYLFVDQAGVVCQAALPAAVGGVTSVCTNGGFLPMWSNGALDCSIISQSVLANCTTGTHLGVGIGGPAIAVGYTGNPIECKNLALTIYGSGLTTGGGQWIVSDKKFKTNIQTVSSALEKITKMRGVSYNLDAKKYPEYNFSEGKTIGFIAQELKEVLPDAVMYTDKGFFAVNYDAVIPVLTEGIKEQQTQMEALQLELENYKLQITELRNKLNQLAPGDVKINVNSLEVAPNPITGTSTISYKLNNPGAASLLIIADLQGKLIKQIALPRNAKEGQLQVSKSDLPNGLYIFSLLNGNTEIQSTRVFVSQ